MRHDCFECDFCKKIWKLVLAGGAYCPPGWAVVVRGQAANDVIGRDVLAHVCEECLSKLSGVKEAKRVAEEKDTAAAEAAIRSL